jgi:hypothetical protein
LLAAYLRWSSISYIPFPSFFCEQVLTSKEVLTKWFAKGGKLGPQRLATFRKTIVGNVAEEAAFAAHLKSLSDFESAAASSPAVPTPTPYSTEPDGMRHRGVHHATADASLAAEAPTAVAPPAISLTAHAPPAAPVALFDMLNGLLREVGAPTGPRAHYAILFIFMIAFLLPMLLGVVGRILALGGVL